MSPTVSVILPCYNHQAYVSDALSSVLGQTLGDIEIIAIDDCSTDDTASILESFDDRRLTVIRHETNQGSAQTVNEGIRLAGAPYVAILNSDDLYRPNRLAECLDAARTTGALLLGTDLELVDGAGEVVRDSGFWWNAWYGGLKDIYRESGDLAGTLIAGNIFISTSNFFLDRRLVQSIGPLTDYRYVQDYEFLLRALVAHPHEVAWMDMSLLRYRLHGKNTILDDPLIPARQTLEILARWMPDLAVGEHAAARLRRFETHLLKLESYVERGASDKIHALWRADAANYQGLLRDREQSAHALSMRTSELEHQIEVLQTELAEARAAHEIFRQQSAELEAGMGALNNEVDALRCNDRDLRITVEQLRLNNSDLLGAVGKQQEALERVYSSVSFRLGYRLLQPARGLRRLFRSA